MTSEEDGDASEPGAVLDERYPARRVLGLVANKWTPIVLYCLAGGTRHFGQMQRRIPGLSKKMLAQVLRALERDGLVKRRVYRQVPPKTDYELTALGHRMHEPIAMLCGWAERNTDVLTKVEARRRRAARLAAQPDDA